ncbi:MAG TPA: hypothetical protein VGP09_17415 [Caballeronia sp.]|nr:hypothetical protein [Caballeronia sp.]
MESKLLENRMVASEQSLRVLVEKWLGAVSTGHLQMRSIQRLRAGRNRCVCIEVERAPGSEFSAFTLFFSVTTMASGVFIRQRQFALP